MFELQNRDLFGLMHRVKSFVEEGQLGWSNQIEKYPVFRFTNTSGLGKTRMVCEMANGLMDQYENTCCAFVSYNLGNTLKPEETIGFEQAVAIRLLRSVFDDRVETLGETMANQFTEIYKFNIWQVVEIIVKEKKPDVLFIGIDEVQMLGENTQSILRSLIASGTAMSVTGVPVVLAIAGTIPPGVDYDIDPSQGKSARLDLPLLNIKHIENIIDSELPDSCRDKVMTLGGMARPISNFAKCYLKYIESDESQEQVISNAVDDALEMDRVNGRLPELDWSNVYHELFNTRVEDWPDFNQLSLKKLVFERSDSSGYGSNNPIALYTSDNMTMSRMFKTPTKLWQQFEVFTANHLALKGNAWLEAARKENIPNEMELSRWLSGAYMNRFGAYRSTSLQRPTFPLGSRELKSHFPKVGQPVREFFGVDSVEDLCKKTYVNGAGASFADVIGFYKGTYEGEDVLFMECVQCKFGESSNGDLKNFQKEEGKMLDGVGNLESGWDGVRIVPVIGYVSSRTTPKQADEIRKYLDDVKDRLVYFVSEKEARNFYGDCLLHSLDASRFN
eukprot:TRINITY_DN128_c0_g1_i11.p1 TRINITY_DN128_c0_g1~~TRINITY_DN128_c0_g1_i11.p1  ORF type:complete len:560 (-),score=117.79 TRINITY_DN128_c0_g1_i11:167-1846(-)